MKSTFNKEHDIFIHGVPVELYAEKKDQGTVHNGLYSLQTGWIDIPNKIEPTDNDAAVEAKYTELKELIDKCETAEVADELLDKIYTMRKAGLADAGEFSTENLAFKKLRNEGVMNKLRQLKKQEVDKQLSLESYNEALQAGEAEIIEWLKQRQVKVGHGFNKLSKEGTAYYMAKLINSLDENIINKIKEADFSNFNTKEFTLENKEALEAPKIVPCNSIITHLVCLYINPETNKTYNEKPTEEETLRRSIKIKMNKLYNKKTGWDRKGYYFLQNNGNKYEIVTNLGKRQHEVVITADSLQELNDILADKLNKAQNNTKNESIKESYEWKGPVAKVTFDNGEVITTCINGTDEEIKAYYMNNIFNLGAEEDDMHKVVKVEVIRESVEDVHSNFKSMAKRIVTDFKVKGYPKSNKFYMDFAKEAVEGFKNDCGHDVKISTGNGELILTLEDTYQAVIDTQTHKIKFSDLENSNYMFENKIMAASIKESLQDEYKQAFDLLVEGENIVGTLDTDFGKQFIKDVESLYQIKSYKSKLRKAKDLLMDIHGYLVDEQYDVYNAKIDKFMNNSKNESVNESTKKYRSVVADDKYTRLRDLYGRRGRKRTLHVKATGGTKQFLSGPKKEYRHIKTGELFYLGDNSDVMTDIMGEPYTKFEIVNESVLYKQNESITENYPTSREELINKYNGCITINNVTLEVSNLYNKKQGDYSNGYGKSYCVSNGKDNKVFINFDKAVNYMKKLNNKNEELKKVENMEINEGMWASPFTVKNAKKVAKLLANPITLGELNSEEKQKELWNVIGDDSFWDAVANEATVEPDCDARPLIISNLEAWIENKENFREDAYHQEAEDIIVKAIAKFDNNLKKLTESKNVYKPSTILKALDIERNWYKEIGLGEDERAPQVMFFIIDNDEIKDTKLVDRQDVYTYKPQANEYYLDRLRDTGFDLTDYNLSHVQKMVDSWNEGKKFEDVDSLCDKIDNATADLQSLIKTLAPAAKNPVVESINKCLAEALEEEIWGVEMFLDTVDGDPEPGHVEFTRDSLIDFLNDYGYELSKDASDEEIKECAEDYEMTIKYIRKPN